MYFFYVRTQIECYIVIILFVFVSRTKLLLEFVLKLRADTCINTFRL